MRYLHSEEVLAGFPIKHFIKGEALPNPDKYAIKLTLDWGDDHSFETLLQDLLAQPKTSEITALVIGMWDPEPYDATPEAVLKFLVEHKAHFPKLKHFFLGDMTSEENEISWICHMDLAFFFAVYPKLETLKIRGANDLALNDLGKLTQLKTLIIESGGLGRQIIEQITSADLQNLEHLELWLGDENYGANTNIYDFEDLLSGDLFPSLKYLGLRNSEHADELAPVVATSPLLLRVDTLDMSLGNMSDQGGQAFLKSSALGNLKQLDLYHHYFSNEMMEALKALPMNVDVGDQNKPDDWGDGEMHRYIYIGE